eukprot:TRINITY_DN9340_c0_g1_i1.p1 TRINITY_DN9340_c0_g1~~TRINITY_DN9340_c0_g1_i1.p1  ORF type:complete len:473 (+),score=90.94 TRINITY_DN9340_c0_g1_i1:104-1522(+)
MSSVSSGKGAKKPRPKSTPLELKDAWRSYASALLELMLHPADRRSIYIKNVFPLATPELAKRFSNAAGSLTVVDGIFLPEQSADVDIVKTSGFVSLPNAPNGLRFGLYCMNPLPPMPTQRIILSRVIVGKALARAQQDADSMLVLPEGYHSLYVPTNQGLKEGAAPPSARRGHLPPFPHAAYFADQYVSFDPSRALPTHMIEFEISADAVPRMERGPCHLCGDPVAVAACVQCEQRFCGKCEREVHTTGQHMQKHTRVPLEVASVQTDMRFCPSHKGTVCSKFCWKCGVEVCDDCKQAPIHRGVDHEFMPLDQACQRVTKELESIVAKRSVLQVRTAELVGQTEQLSKDAHTRAAQLKAELLAHLQNYLLTQQIADERKFELARAASDIDRTAEFLISKQQQCNQAEFLRTWSAMSDQRLALQHRVQHLADSQFTMPLMNQDAQAEIAELKKQVAMRDKVIAVLKKQVHQAR